METSSRNCHIPIIEYVSDPIIDYDQTNKKDSYPPGGHHDGSMQTTEAEAYINLLNNGQRSK